MRAVSSGFLACAVSVLFLAPALALGQPPAGPRPDGDVDESPPAHVLARLLQPHVSPSAEGDREAAGLPASRHPEVLTWERVYALAILRARDAAGPRADALDPKAVAERAAKVGFDDFGRFRKEFLAARRRGEGLRDPSGEFLALLDALQRIDNARRKTAFLQNVFTLLSELIKGESAGLSQLHLDQVEALLIGSRQILSAATTEYRDRLERFRLTIGLSVRAPVIPDRSIVASFGRVFDQTRSWQERPDRSLRELLRIIQGLPAAGDIVVEGRSLLALMAGNMDQQEEALTIAARLAIRNRGDRDKPAARGDDAVVELDIRRRLRRLSELRRTYEAQRRSYELAIRLIDQGLEQVALPSGIAPLARPSMLATAITGLLASETRRAEEEDRLVATWTTFQTERLALYRELGILPYDDWKSFFNDLSAR